MPIWIARAETTAEQDGKQLGRDPEPGQSLHGRDRGDDAEDLLTLLGLESDVLDRGVHPRLHGLDLEVAGLAIRREAIDDVLHGRVGPRLELGHGRVRAVDQPLGLDGGLSSEASQFSLGVGLFLELLGLLLSVVHGGLGLELGRGHRLVRERAGRLGLARRHEQEHRQHGKKRSKGHERDAR
ncbi:MAG: hypothetical protein IPK69_11810 [Phycisphaerales bacterium]|nr:MAG: hypothetical protein IPK69_11810 [Phycisphaerales bacterium]